MYSVKLQYNQEPGSDYINASYVDVRSYLFVTIFSNRGKTHYFVYTELYRGIGREVPT